MASRKTKARLLSIAGISAVLLGALVNFGPVAFGHLLDRINPPPAPAPVADTADDMSQLIMSLTEALRDAVEAPVPAPAPEPSAVDLSSSQPEWSEPTIMAVLDHEENPIERVMAQDPAIPRPAMPDRAVAQISAEEPVKRLVNDRAVFSREQAELPLQAPPVQVATIDPDGMPVASQQPLPTLPEAPKTGPAISFAVFEREKFSLCGHGDFSAVVSGGSIVLSSNDRSIPGRTFRGFERKLTANAPLELWPDCVVAAAYQTLAGTTRIAISSLRGNE